jgi:hypothetical protein
LLSNKFLYIIFLVSFSFGLLDCGDSSDEKNKETLKNYKDPEVQLKEAKSVLGNNTKVTYLGLFDDDKKEKLVAGLEINTKDEWGIRFASLDISGDKPKKIFETQLLDGSFNSSRVEKIKLSSLDYELLFYYSGDYFLGSGGGEVFSYLVDFNDKEVYYAHLVADSKKVSLYFSNDIDNKEIENFFLNVFKKDFPSYELVSQDVVLDD